MRVGVEGASKGSRRVAMPSGVGWQVAGSTTYIQATAFASALFRVQIRAPLPLRERAMTRRRFAAGGAKRSEARKQRKRPEGFWSSGLGSAAGPQPGALLAPRVAPRGGPGGIGLRCSASEAEELLELARSTPQEVAGGYYVRVLGSAEIHRCQQSTEHPVGDDGGLLGSEVAPARWMLPSRLYRHLRRRTCRCRSSLSLTSVNAM